MAGHELSLILKSVTREYADPRKWVPEAARRACQQAGHVSPTACAECKARRAFDPPAPNGRRPAANKLCHDRGHHERACKSCVAAMTHLADGNPEQPPLFEVAP